MARDSLFGETILWSGRPSVVSTPLAFRLTALVAAVLSLVTLSFGIVVGTAFQAHVGGMFAFSAWCATLALGSLHLPKIWRSGIEYIVTETHVIWRRGPLRRSIERSAISYALIRWDAHVSGAGDLLLVRAVPTGALRRTLRLSLVGVVGPDRLWAIVRGLIPPAPLGDGGRPLTQRLDPGERVLWSAMPLAAPWTVRRTMTAAVALFLALSSARMLTRSVPPLHRVIRLHALPTPSLVLFVAAVALSVALLAAVAAGVGYAACIRPLRLSRSTRYFVTDQRVLIRRGHEELHLDRARIAYVIFRPSRRVRGMTGAKPGDLNDVFLVLDGPHARAFASSGAFGESSGEALVPVFSSIEDAETVGVLLGPTEGEPLRRAA